ncbi:hypothetical protein AB833_13265 [Chromatiales bacterium (ex Bugula neritina AB1)]|nr:hypothetical protein AB833_13265 [Chromatiales bacterium (ex Bugula neritina AB1)]
MADQVDLVVTGVRDQLSENELAERLVAEFGQPVENFADLIAGAYTDDTSYTAQSAVGFSTAEQGKQQLEKLGLVCEIKSADNTRLEPSPEPVPQSAADEAETDEQSADFQSGDVQTDHDQSGELEFDDPLVDGITLEKEPSADDSDDALPHPNGLLVVDLSFEDEINALSESSKATTVARNTEIPVPEQPLEIPIDDESSDQPGDSDQQDSSSLALSADELTFDLNDTDAELPETAEDGELAELEELASEEMNADLEDQVSEEIPVQLDEEISVPDSVPESPGVHSSSESSDGEVELSLSLSDDLEAGPLASGKSTIKGVVHLSSGSKVSDFGELSLTVEAEPSRETVAASAPLERSVAADGEAPVAVESESCETGSAQPSAAQIHTGTTVPEPEPDPEPEPEPEHNVVGVREVAPTDGQADTGSQPEEQVEKADQVELAEPEVKVEKTPPEPEEKAPLSAMEGLLKQVAAVAGIGNKESSAEKSDTQSPTVEIESASDTESAGEAGPMEETAQAEVNAETSDEADDAVIEPGPAQMSADEALAISAAGQPDTANVVAESGESIDLAPPATLPASLFSDTAVASQEEELKKSRDQVAELKAKIQEDLDEESLVSSEFVSLARKKRMIRAGAVAGFLMVAGAAGFGVYSSGILLEKVPAVTAVQAVELLPEVATAELEEEDAEQIELDLALERAARMSNPQNASNRQLLAYMAEEFGVEFGSEYDFLNKKSEETDSEPVLAAAIPADSRSTLWVKDHHDIPAAQFFDEWVRQEVNLAVFLELHRRLIDEKKYDLATDLGNKTRSSMLSVMGQQRLAREYAKGGEFLKAEQILRESSSAVYSITEPASRLVAMADFALSEKALGLRDDSFDTLLKASILVRKLGYPEERTVSMLAVADYMDQMGEKEDSRLMLAEALSAAQQLPKLTSARDLAIRLVVLKEAAMGRANEATRHVELIDDQYAAVTAYHAIALSLESRGEKSHAQSVIETAFQAADQIENEAKRDRVLKRVKLVNG